MVVSSGNAPVMLKPAKRLTCFWVVTFDRFLHRFPRQELIHLREEFFSSGLTFLKAVFCFGKGYLIHGMASLWGQCIMPVLKTYSELP